MASILCPNTHTLSHLTRFKPPSVVSFTSPPKQLSCFSGQQRTTRIRRRKGSVLTRAGASANSYIIAAVIPLSLVAVTIFASIRVADRLDEKFLQEMAMYEALKEADEDGEGEGEKSPESEPVLTRTRNRPKREA